MTIAITIRSVPQEVRDELAGRAARAGQSLQEYLVAQLIDLAHKPSLEEALRDIRARAAAYPPVTITEILEDHDADRR